ncbi:hypothetical protein [Legionella waltersii]|uniref:Uncharacterized protein n=1 Tax=Legionella waltersii TaxID=66969 RepID=A0A0W1A1B9_9GAMM|nr:hypothetical protein [Legionella waltersii]KTD75130.1 hypothetical protein Lwal_3171 [Legionella waltersii]SNV04912.1 Uncharacterised protein [Legionella waltersii]
MQVKKEVKPTLQKETKYEVVVCVKDTNNDNGPGHVSAFTRSTSEGEESTVTHTSFFPGAIGSLLNALTLGSVPVIGQLAPDHQQDYDEADHVLVSPVSKEQYQDMKKEQQKFSKEVENGRSIYSVFGTTNPFANLIPSFLSGSEGARQVSEQYKAEVGCFPPEDHCGIEVYSNDKHPEVVPEPMKVHNCASSITSILQAGGFKFDNPTIPTFFTSQLQDLGFKEINKEHVLPGGSTGTFKTK